MAMLAFTAEIPCCRHGAEKRHLPPKTRPLGRGGLPELRAPVGEPAPAIPMFQRRSLVPGSGLPAVALAGPLDDGSHLLGVERLHGSGPDVAEGADLEQHGGGSLVVGEVGHHDDKESQVSPPTPPPPGTTSRGGSEFESLHPGAASPAGSCHEAVVTDDGPHPPVELGAATARSEHCRSRQRATRVPQGWPSRAIVPGRPRRPVGPGRHFPGPWRLEGRRAGLSCGFRLLGMVGLCV